MNRQHAPIAMAGVAATAALLLPFSGPAAGAGEVDRPPDQGTRPCFIEPPRWNEALDGPLPRCH